MGSGAPEPALSVPPSTDEIDSEWGSPKTNDTQPAGGRGPAKSKGTLSGLSPLEAKAKSSAAGSAPAKPIDPAPSRPVESQPLRGAPVPSKTASAEAETRRERRVASAVAAPSGERPRSGASLYLMGAAVIAAVGLWFAVRTSRSEPTPPPAATEVRPAEPVVTATPPAEPTALAPAEVPSQPESPAASAVAAPAEPAAAQPSAGAPAGGASAESPETIAVLINIRPEGTQLFCKGKAVGKTPFTIEIPQGQRRICEAVNPGFVTRKVILDGSKTEISFGMKVEEPE
jgi:hypothetical protein